MPVASPDHLKTGPLRGPSPDWLLSVHRWEGHWEEDFAAPGKGRSSAGPLCSARMNRQDSSTGHNHSQILAFVQVLAGQQRRFGLDIGTGRIERRVGRSFGTVHEPPARGGQCCPACSQAPPA